jgi:hypothetical protein
MTGTPLHIAVHLESCEAQDGISRPGAENPLTINTSRYKAKPLPGPLGLSPRDL